MNDIPDEVDDLRFAILDNSNPADPDYFFIPLIFLESFNSPAVVLDVGGNMIGKSYAFTDKWSGGDKVTSFETIDDAVTVIEAETAEVT